MVDVIIVAAIAFPLILAFIWIMEAFHTDFGWSDYKSRALSGNGVVLLSILCHWYYCARTEASAYQATLGKRLFGLKVVSTDHKTVTMEQASWRHFAKFLSTFALFAGFAMALFHPSKQSLHDMIAGTLVLRKD